MDTISLTWMHLPLCGISEDAPLPDRYLLSVRWRMGQATDEAKGQVRHGKTRGGKLRLGWKLGGFHIPAVQCGQGKTNLCKYDGNTNINQVNHDFSPELVYPAVVARGSISDVLLPWGSLCVCNAISFYLPPAMSRRCRA